MDLDAVCHALADTITAGVSREIRGYPYPKGNEELPCVIVQTADDYLDPYGSISGGDGGMSVANFVLVLMAPCRTTYEDGLRILNEMQSAGVGLPNSVIDAIEADRTLGGTVDDTLLGVSSGHSGIQPDTEGRPQAVLCRWPLTVWKQRS